MIRQRTIRGSSSRMYSRLMLVTALGATSCSDRPLFGEADLGSTGDHTTTGTNTSSPGGSDGSPEPESTGGIGGDTTATASETTEGLMPPEPPTLVVTLSPIKRFDFTWGLVEGADHYRLLESVLPDAPFVPLVDGIVAESISLTVPLHLRSGARYMLQACNAVGCTDSDVIAVDGTMAEAVGYVKGDGIQTTYFGYDLALSSDGTVMAVRTNSAVFMLTQDAEGTWTTAQVLEASVGSLALSADGNVLVAGGEAHTFERDGSGQWIPRGGVIPAVGRLVLSADGSTLVISRNQGQVVVFEREPAGDWSERASFEPEPGAPPELLGIALSVDGSTLAMGTWTIEVVVRDATGAWAQQGLFEAHPADTTVAPGSSMALSADGSTLVVGATAAESVPVFERNAAGEWTEHARIEIPYALEKEFGGSVALDGTGELLVIGAIADASNAVGIGGDETNASVARSGATHVFALDATSGEWLQRAYVKAPNTDWGDLFGLRVALSGDGNVLAVAAPYEDGSSAGFGGDPADDSALGAGAVYLY